MRHLLGVVLAIVMAAAVFCAATWGYVRLAAQSSRVAGGASLLSDHHVLLAVGALAGTGLLAGILIAAPRVSPLAAGLPGLALLGLTVLYLVSVARADQLIPLRSHVFGAGFETLLARGILGAAGLALIVPLFVPSRWRGRGGAETAGESEPADQFELADQFGPALTEDGQLVRVAPRSGGLRVGEGAAAPEDAVPPAQPTGAAGAVGASAWVDASPTAVQHGGLPRRPPPPGLVY